MLVTPGTYTVNTGFAVIFFKKLNHRNEAEICTLYKLTLFAFLLQVFIDSQNRNTMYCHFLLSPEKK